MDKETAVELGESFAGEVGFTTPGQTVAEQKIGEAYGVKPSKTDAELLAELRSAEGGWVASWYSGWWSACGGSRTGRATQGCGGPTAPVTPAVPGEAAPPPIPPTPREAFALLLRVLRSRPLPARFRFRLILLALLRFLLPVLRL